MGDSPSGGGIVIKIGERKCPPLSDVLSVPVAFTVTGNATAVSSVIGKALAKRDSLYDAAEATLRQDAKAWLKKNHCKGACEDNGSITLGPFRAGDNFNVTFPTKASVCASVDSFVWIVVVRGCRERTSS
jgi:hypothetical protein